MKASEKKTDMAFGRKGRKTKTGGTRGSNQYGPRGVSTQDQEAAERESAHAAQAAQSAASGAQGLAADIIEEPPASLTPAQVREEARREREARLLERLTTPDINEDARALYTQKSLQIEAGVAKEERDLSLLAQQKFGESAEVSLDPTTFNFDVRSSHGIADYEEFAVYSVRGTVTLGGEDDGLVLEVESKRVVHSFAQPGTDELDRHEEVSFFHVDLDGTRTEVSSLNDIEQAAEPRKVSH